MNKWWWLRRTHRNCMVDYLLDIVSRWKSFQVPLLQRVRWFMISVNTAGETVLRLCTCKGCTGHANVQEPKSGSVMSNKLDICSLFPVMYQSKNYIRQKIYNQNFSRWYHTGHRWSCRCSVWICLNDEGHSAFIYAANCVTLGTDLVYIIAIFKIA
jgi:hypothetical protein